MIQWVWNEVNKTYGLETGLQRFGGRRFSGYSQLNCCDESDKPNTNSLCVKMTHDVSGIQTTRKYHYENMSECIWVK